MTLGELIGLLEEYRDEHGEDCEVRLMTQQNWPFENRIASVTSGAEMNEAEHDDPHEFADDQDVAEDAMVYIVEGEQLCYPVHARSDERDLPVNHLSLLIREVS